jgi:hypothetical protein
MTDVKHIAALCAVLLALRPLYAHAGAADVLPARAFQAAQTLQAPAPNAAFFPGPESLTAPSFAGTLDIGAVRMQMQPPLEQPIILGRDARIFPGVRLEFFTLGDVLVPAERGEMVRESAPERRQATGA